MSVHDKNESVKHSPEPWQTHDHVIIDHNGNAIDWVDGDCGYSTDRANAARIVACVNACAGIPTETLINPPKKPTVVCLCGSTRFYREFVEANYTETMAGKIVLSVGFYPHAVNEIHGEGVGITSEQKEELDQLHLRKIDLADEVLVINIGGYIGDSTRREIAYARAVGKPIRWLQPEYEVQP